MWPSNKRRLVHGELFRSLFSSKRICGSSFISCFAFVSYSSFFYFRGVDPAISALTFGSHSCLLSAPQVENEVAIRNRIRVQGRHKYPSRPKKIIFCGLEHRYRNLVPAEYALQCDVLPYVGLLANGKAARIASIVLPEAKEPVMTFPLLY